LVSVEGRDATLVVVRASVRAESGVMVSSLPREGRSALAPQFMG
jgi:hypothetical protein